MKGYPKHLEEFVADALTPGEMAREPYVAGMTYARFGWVVGWLVPRWVYRKVWLVLTDRRLLVIRAKWWNMKPMHVRYAVDRAELTATEQKIGPFGLRDGLLVRLDGTTKRFVFSFRGSRRLAQEGWRDVIASMATPEATDTPSVADVANATNAPRE
ncbi:MAG: hypothetical protein ACXVJ7_14465 [Acidimicrobiia bacterium]